MHKYFAKQEYICFARPRTSMRYTISMNKKLLVSILVVLFARFTPKILDSKINGSVNPSEALQTAANVAWGVSAVLQFVMVAIIISLLVLWFLRSKPATTK